MIPMVDLKSQYHTLKSEIDQAVLDAIESCQFILGPNVTAFEKETATYLGAGHAVSCASGTDALQLAILAAGIKPGDEVITTPFTFIATAEAICYAGATPVFVDIDPKTFNIDTNLIEAAITPRTKAIIPVHLFGQPADMAPIAALCSTHNLLLIEDCAQSFGAAIDGKMTGTMGSLGCFSFFPSKNLGCYGDGGLITCNSDELAEQMDHESGLLGVSGRTSDVRELLALEAAGDKAATLALAIFVRRAAECIAAAATSLPRLDAIVFTGGIGENAFPVRARICDGLQFLGIRLDARRNRASAPIISTPASRVTVRVIRTDEEVAIARTVCRVLGLSTKTPTAARVRNG